MTEYVGLLIMVLISLSLYATSLLSVIPQYLILHPKRELQPDQVLCFVFSLCSHYGKVSISSCQPLGWSKLNSI